MSKTTTDSAAATIAGTTDAEAAILASTAAAIAAGQDPFGDEDDDDTAPTVEDKDDDNDAGDEAAAEGEKADPDNLSAEALAAVAGDEEDGAQVETVSTPAAEVSTEAQAVEAPATPRFQGIDPAEYKTQRAAIVAEKAKGLKDLMEGVIEPDAYSALVDAADEKLEALAVARTLHEANAQTEAQTQAQVLDKIMRAAKADGIDYADAKTARRFDAEMALMDADGDKRPYAERAADAHKTVATLLGKPKATPEPPKEPPKPRENAKGPVTLRNVPAAEVPNNGGSWVDALGKLSGQDYEAAYAKLTPAQKAQLLND